MRRTASASTGLQARSETQSLSSSAAATRHTPTAAKSSYEMNAASYEALLKLPGNNVCVDCGASRPDWGSPKIGILFCFQCSGAHRGLGTHISFVRSVRMDDWTEEQMQLMWKGGNKQCNDFLQSHGIEWPNGITSVTDSTTTAQLQRLKYDNPVCELYRAVLQARVQGLPEPTELPPPGVERTAPAGRKGRMEGFGSHPYTPHHANDDSLALIKKVLMIGVPVLAVVVVTGWFIVS